MSAELSSNVDSMFRDFVSDVYTSSPVSGSDLITDDDDDVHDIVNKRISSSHICLWKSDKKSLIKDIRRTMGGV